MQQFHKHKTTIVSWRRIRLIKIKIMQDFIQTMQKCLPLFNGPITLNQNLEI